MHIITSDFNVCQFENMADKDINCELLQNLHSNGLEVVRQFC